MSRSNEYATSAYASHTPHPCSPRTARPPHRTNHNNSPRELQWTTFPTVRYTFPVPLSSQGTLGHSRERPLSSKGTRRELDPKPLLLVSGPLFSHHECRCCFLEAFGDRRGRSASLSHRKRWTDSVHPVTRNLKPLHIHFYTHFSPGLVGSVTTWKLCCLGNWELLLSLGVVLLSEPWWHGGLWEWSDQVCFYALGTHFFEVNWMVWSCGYAWGWLDLVWFGLGEVASGNSVVLRWGFHIGLRFWRVLSFDGRWNW